MRVLSPPIWCAPCSGAAPCVRRLGLISHLLGLMLSQLHSSSFLCGRVGRAHAGAPPQAGTPANPALVVISGCRRFNTALHAFRIWGAWA